MRLTRYLNEKVRDVSFKSDEYYVIRGSVITDEDLEKAKKIIKVLEKDCKKFIREIKPAKFFMYRGTHRLPEDKPIRRVVPRSNRRPTDLHIELHEKLGNEFRKKFGWDPRSEGVFATFDYDIARGYGSNTASFWPIGDYKYIYSPDIEDVFTYFGGTDYRDLESRAEDLKDEYWRKYDQGGRGTWEYDGEDLETNHWSEAVRKAKDMNTEVDYDENNLVWIPEMEEWEYVDERRSELEDELDDNIYDLVKSYKERNLAQTAEYARPVEVMFKCKAYYVVDIKYDHLIYEALVRGRKLSNLVTGHSRILKPYTKQAKDPF